MDGEECNQHAETSHILTVLSAGWHHLVVDSRRHSLADESEQTFDGQSEASVLGHERSVSAVVGVQMRKYAETDLLAPASCCR